MDWDTCSIVEKVKHPQKSSRVCEIATPKTRYGFPSLLREGNVSSNPMEEYARIGAGVGSWRMPSPLGVYPHFI